MNSTLQRRSNGTYAPGVSGNPKGRPPGLSSFKTLADESQFSKRLFEILDTKSPVRESDSAAEMPRAHGDVRFESVG